MRVNSREIEFSAKALNTIENNYVEYEKPTEEWDIIEDVIEKIFNTIEWCDQLYVVKGKDIANDYATLCKIEYARRLEKEIIYLN